MIKADTHATPVVDVAKEVPVTRNSVVENNPKEEDTNRLRTDVNGVKKSLGRIRYYWWCWWCAEKHRE